MLPFQVRICPTADILTVNVQLSILRNKIAQVLISPFQLHPRESPKFIFCAKSNIRKLTGIFEELFELSCSHPNENFTASERKQLFELIEDVHTQICGYQLEINQREAAANTLLDLSFIGGKFSYKRAQSILDAYQLRPCKCAQKDRSLICRSLSKIRHIYTKPDTHVSPEYFDHDLRKTELHETLPRHLFELIKWH